MPPRRDMSAGTAHRQQYSVFAHERGVLRVRNKELRFGTRTFVMGIVNVSPDSFSGDGLADSQAAVALALDQVRNGADIVDIGGQSTRPGYSPIDQETESRRILPVIEALRKASDAIISVDTFSPAVAQKALDAGADILNSIWGLKETLLEVVKRKMTPVVLMHNKAEAKYSRSVVEEVADHLRRESEMALAAGLVREQIILDPGIGFGKTAEHNLEILSRLNQITSLGFPTLIGTSRKSTVGKVIGRPVQEREFGTAASLALAVASGIDIVRVHDAKAMVDVVKVSDAITRGWRPDDWEEGACTT